MATGVDPETGGIDAPNAPGGAIGGGGDVGLGYMPPDFWSSLRAGWMNPAFNTGGYTGTPGAFNDNADLLMNPYGYAGNQPPDWMFGGMKDAWRRGQNQTQGYGQRLADIWANNPEAKNFSGQGSGWYGAVNAANAAGNSNDKSGKELIPQGMTSPMPSIDRMPAPAPPQITTYPTPVDNTFDYGMTTAPMPTWAQSPAERYMMLAKSLLGV